MPCTRIPTVAFHGINDISDDYTSLSSAAFRQLIASLAKDYQFIDDAKYMALRGVTVDGDPLLHVTFDDAYESIVGELLWALDSFNLRATVYVVPDYIESWNDWNAKCSYRIRHASLEDLHRLVSAGFRIGDHTLGHQNLLKFDGDDLRERFAQGRALFASKGLDPASVAYPFGQCNSTTMQIAQEFYRLGFSTETKSSAIDFGEGPLGLRRIVVSRGCTAQSVLKRLNSY